MVHSKVDQRKEVAGLEPLGQTLISPLEASRISPLRLAYLGDTVWELMVRQRLMEKGGKVRNMHRETVNSVNAGAQAMALTKLLPHLTEDEQDIIRRGRNATPRHSAPKGQQAEDYHAATGLEALFGFLYLSGQYPRMLQLFHLTLQEEPLCPNAP